MRAVEGRPGHKAGRWTTKEVEMDKHTERTMLLSERDNLGGKGHGKLGECYSPFSKEARAVLAYWAWVLVQRELKKRREEQSKQKEGEP